MKYKLYYHLAQMESYYTATDDLGLVFGGHMDELPYTILNEEQAAFFKLRHPRTYELMERSNEV